MIRVHALVCLIVLTVVGSAMAQQAGIKRTVLRSIDFPEGYTTVTAIVELPPGTCAGRHTHPGIDSGFVIHGDLVLKVDGTPEQTLTARDSYDTPPRAPHDAFS